MFRPLAALLSALLLAAPGAQAQQVPVPPVVRLIVPFPSGGSTDVLARALAPQLAARLNTTVIVENRAGGSSLIGANAVAKAPADGSHLLFTTNSLLTAAATMRSVPFDAARDLIPVAMVSEGPMVIGVTATSPIRTVADFVAAARAKPDALTYGSSGVGTFLHLSTEWVNDAAKIQTKHIPYKGAAPAGVDLAAGTLDFMIAARATILPHVQSGRVRLIGVTSSVPSPAFPGLPTLASVAPGFSVDLWNIVLAPAATPPALVQLLNREIIEVARTRQLRALMEAEGAQPGEETPAQLATRFRDSMATWRRIATSKNIVLE